MVYRFKAPHEARHNVIEGLKGVFLEAPLEPEVYG